MMTEANEKRRGMKTRRRYVDGDIEQEGIDDRGPDRSLISPQKNRKMSRSRRDGTLG